MPKRKHAEGEENEDENAEEAFTLKEDVYIYAPCTMAQVNESNVNTTIQALVPGQYLADAAALRSVRLRQLWGTDVYTEESDLVAVLVHTGHVALHADAPAPPLLVTLAVCARQPAYLSSTRHGLTSRGWDQAHPGVSYKVVRCLAYAGDAADLDPRITAATSGRRALPSISLMAPGYPPSSLHVIFDLCNEPMYKYSLPLVADRGLEASDWTSARLRFESLYLEGSDKRYELSRSGTHRPQGSHVDYDCYKFAEVLEPQALDSAEMLRLGVPLPSDRTTVLHSDVDWEDFAWGHHSVRVGTKEYPLLRLKFLPHAEPVDAAGGGGPAE